MVKILKIKVTRVEMVLKLMKNRKNKIINKLVILTNSANNTEMKLWNTKLIMKNNKTIQNPRKVTYLYY